MPALILSAPAPLPCRPAPYRLPCGACLMAWRGTQYLACFSPGGLYRAQSLDGSSEWVGTWRLAGDVLHVRERGANSDYWHDFAFPLTPNRSGEVRGEGLSLSPLR